MASRWSQVSASRAEIEVGRNPLRHVRRTRTKKSTVVGRYLCPNSSADGAIRLAGLRAFSALPAQITVSSTFPGILTYIWRVDWFQIKPKGCLGKPLAIAIGRYRSSTDRNWMLRPMGLANCKNDPAYPVTVEYRGDSTWDSDDFRFDTLASDAIPSSRTFTARKDPANPTNPKHGWLWILYELVRGKAGAKLARKPTSRHADRPNPKYYAQRTAAVASARLLLGESITIDDPVIFFEGRRRLEIPLVLSRARTRKAYRYARAVKALSRIQFRARARPEQERCFAPGEF